MKDLIRAETVSRKPAWVGSLEKTLALLLKVP